MTSKHVLLGLLIVVVFGMGYMMGRFSVAGSSTTIGTMMSGNPQTNGTTGTPTTPTTPSGATQASGGTQINTANLSDGQRTMLKALGINTDTLVVTPQMVACAEASLGAGRANEIKNGATPSFTEGAKLVACYK